eukprot:Em0013g606a
METEVDFGSWTLVETVAWAKKAFGDDVSASFEGPASDSTTLIDSGTTGTKSVTKDLPAKEIRSVTMNQATDSTDRESVTTGSIIHVTSNSTESVPKDIASDAIATKCNKDQTGTGPVTKELVADTAALEIVSVTSPEDLDQQQEDDIIGNHVHML